MTMGRKSWGRCAVVFSAALLAWQCAGRGSQADLSPLEKFRAGLADPARYDLRSGMDIDNEAFRNAIEDFGRENKGTLRKIFEESIEKLPAGKPPEPSEYGKVVTLDVDESQQGTLEALKLQWVLFPDIEKLVLGGINYLFPGAAMEQKFMTPPQIGVWLLFLHAAEPQQRLCGREEDQIIVCADYGGQDIFVVKLQPLEYAWVLDSVTWWQRGAEGGEGAGAWEQPPSPPQAAGELEVPPVVQEEDGWESYRDPIILGDGNVKDLMPGQSTPEAAVVHFYASRIRRDEHYLDVLPPKEQWTGKLAGALEKMDKWTFIEVRLMGRKKLSEDEVWIKVYMEVEVEGKPDSGMDEVTLNKIGDKWFVVEPPT
jgi:hypothetical protein